METSTITDWLQSGAAWAALLISVGHLSWQAWAGWDARNNRIRAEASRFGPGIWRIFITYDGKDRSSQLQLRARIIKSQFEAALIAERQVPVRRDSHNEPDVDTVALTTMTAAREILVEMDHLPSPSFASEAAVFLRWVDEEEPLRLRMEVEAQGRLFSLSARTMLITPTR
ncbi:hypothetical protein JIP62_06960 [Brevundimonas vitis]|uniref:Uncharacterized protein n=1 Tax=Brevundimonas vitisensis TaxID=2800818 RepID=A0ABX7BSV2_9CAUL|nr:hypothetical protein [Brevundimonas vitisensis]QQQ19818.1 hypothetical protein JIP62_06960 [Brevundimonas vitisensis]